MREIVESESIRFWFFEAHRRDTGLFFGARRVWTYTSPFQQIVVLETETWGRVLVLDGLVQTTDRDEFVYHEMLAHVPLVMHPRPERVLIVGGGDGGALREVLRHPEVQRVVLCEIDPEVIAVVRRHWPETAVVFDDPRVQIRFEEGSRLVQSVEESFDVVLVDSSDPVSHSRSLFEASFLEAVRRILRRPGIYVTQSLSPFYSLAFLKRWMATMRECFDHVGVYTAPVPSYPAGWWSFSMGTTGMPIEPSRVAPDRVQRLAQRTRYYNFLVHQGAFSLPNFLKKEIEA